MVSNVSKVIKRCPLKVEVRFVVVGGRLKVKKVMVSVVDRQCIDASDDGYGSGGCGGEWRWQWW
ncbi:hypothetical protein HanIR_Chr15g0782071 [Helianthus annuus]|nr:hypothetical protein HanIR_Chr15g0782071 [Helianthus annuus]